MDTVVRPHWYQERTLDSAARYIVMLGGTGGGKTWWGPVWLASKIAADHEAGVEDAHYLALGNTSDMARDQMLPYLVRHYHGTHLQGTWHAQKRIYELPTGGKIFFRSAEKPERIEGHHFRAAWVDEPGQMKGIVWPILKRRTGYYQAQVLFTGYPIAMNWYYHDVFKAWEAGDPDFDVIQFASTENPEYSAEEFEKARKTLPGWMFDMTYLGKFRKPAGLVYPEFGEDLFVEPFEIPPDWPVYVGIDPGVFFGVLFLAWNDGVYYAYSDYYSEEVATAADYAQEILSRVRGSLQGYIYDPARLTDVTNLAAEGIVPLYHGSNPVLPGILTVTEFIKGGRLKVLRGGCPNLVDQMERYSWPTDSVTGSIAKENPIKKFDHLPDCLRYLLHTLEGPKEQKQDQVIVYDDPVVISPL